VLDVSFCVANLLGALSTPQGLFVMALSIAEKMVTPKTLHYIRLREALICLCREVERLIGLYSFSFVYSAS
jgi:hypothetical protein